MIDIADFGQVLQIVAASTSKGWDRMIDLAEEYEVAVDPNEVTIPEFAEAIFDAMVKQHGDLNMTYAEIIVTFMGEG